MGAGTRLLGEILALPILRRATLRKLLSFSVSWFLYL